MIVLGTVLLNATTARLFARIAGVFLKKSEGIVIIGASMASRLIAGYLQKNNRHVVLIDNNQNNIEKAKALGLEAISSNIYSDTLSDHIELSDVGYLMALTANSDINQYAIDTFKKQFGEHGSFRLITTDEMSDPENNPEEGLFSHTDDFIKITEAARKYSAVNEIDLKDHEHFEGVIEIIKADENIVPLFLKTPEGDLQIISSFNTDFKDIKEGFQLVYLGKSLTSNGKMPEPEAAKP
jgi:Trk K+ transport system NAD-binding subunit